MIQGHAHLIDLHRYFLSMMAIMALALFMTFLALVSPGYTRDVPAPAYVVNLDLPPTERWAQVVKDYSHYFPLLLKEFEEMFPKELIDAVVPLAADLDRYVPYPYNEEMKGIVAYSGGNATLGQVLLANLFYDITAFRRSKLKGRGACTSIVTADSTGRLYHGRNLDYAFSEALEAMTIIVRFERGGKAVFTGTTYAGYVGILTGCRTNGISISMDERDQGEWWMNAISAFKDKSHGVISFLLRDVLQNSTLTFEETVEILSFTPLIAPSYLIVGGVYKTEAVVITRDRSSAIDQWYINPDNGHWFILETNYDHWKPPPDSDNRRDPGIKAMNDVGRGNINATTLFKVLSTPPVLNDETTYTTVMCTTDPKVYSTVIRFST